jgi:hypothetical protein
MPTDTVAFRLKGDLSNRLDEKLPDDDDEQSQSERLRELLRKGLDADEYEQEKQRMELVVEQAERDRHEAIQHANEVYREMKEVRRRWSRERQRILLALMFLAGGMAFLQVPEFFTYGYLAAGLATMVIALHSGGIIDYVLKRDAPVEGESDPPVFDFEEADTETVDMNDSGGDSQRERVVASE